MIYVEMKRSCREGNLHSTLYCDSETLNIRHQEPENTTENGSRGARIARSLQQAPGTSVFLYREKPNSSFSFFASDKHVPMHYQRLSSAHGAKSIFCS